MYIVGYNSRYANSIGVYMTILATYILMLMIILHIIATYVAIKVILRIYNTENPCNTVPTNGNFCPIIC